MENNPELFGDVLKKCLPAKYKRKELAARLQVSVSYVSLWVRNKRKPNRFIINNLADSYKLSFEQRNRLLTAAGFQPVLVRPDITDEIKSIVSGPELSVREAELLVREVKAYAIRWKRQREARSKDVKKAIIVAAGWQARLLAPEKLETMVFHAAKEAVEASIYELVIVVAPTKFVSRFEKLSELGAGKNIDIRVSTVIQEEPQGLGHAIYSTRSEIGEEPFAVILPVDVDPEGMAIKEMKNCYSKFQKPMIAVNPSRVVAKGEMKRYGLALLGEKVKKGEHGLYFVHEMEEKPSLDDNGRRGREARMIMGRYILTPDIFDILQSTSKNPRTGKIEITDALNELLKGHHFVYAYDLNRTLLPLASIRTLMELVIESMTQPERLERMIKIARKAIEDAQRINN